MESIQPIAPNAIVNPVTTRAPVPGFAATIIAGGFRELPVAPRELVSTGIAGRSPGRGR